MKGNIVNDLQYTLLLLIPFWLKKPMVDVKIYNTLCYY